MNNKNKSYTYALSAILLWSTVATAFKVSLRYMTPEMLLFIGGITAIVVLGFISFFTGDYKNILNLDAKGLKSSAINGFLNPFLYYIVLFKAYSMLPAQIAQPLNYLWPIMLILLSVPLLGQKLKLESVISAIIGFVGVYVISTRGDIFGFNIENPLGVILASASSIIWALYWIFTQKDKRPEIVKLFYNFLFGVFYTFIYVLIFSEFKPIENYGYIASIYVGFFEMGITFFLWMKAMQLSKRNDEISNLVFLSPFLALIFIYFILHEQIYYTTYIGLVLIVSSIFVKQIKLSKKK